jgi:hypothetical protein
MPDTETFDVPPLGMNPELPLPLNPGKLTPYWETKRFDTRPSFLPARNAQSSPRRALPDGALPVTMAA